MRVQESRVQVQVVQARVQDKDKDKGRDKDKDKGMVLVKGWLWRRVDTSVELEGASEDIEDTWGSKGK